MSLLDRFRPSRTQAPNDPLFDELRDALAPDRVKIDGAQRSLLAKDASVFEAGVSGPICYPISTDEVVSIMKIADRHELGVG